MRQVYVQNALKVSFVVLSYGYIILTNIQHPLGYQVRLILALPMLCVVSGFCILTFMNLPKVGILFIGLFRICYDIAPFLIAIIVSFFITNAGLVFLQMVQSGSLQCEPSVFSEKLFPPRYMYDLFKMMLNMLKMEDVTGLGPMTAKMFHVGFVIITSLTNINYLIAIMAVSYTHLTLPTKA